MNVLVSHPTLVREQATSLALMYAFEDGRDGFNWRDVRECALGVIPGADTELREKLLPEFPRHLSIEIADDWSVVKGPTTHRRMQAFPSLMIGKTAHYK